MNISILTFNKHIILIKVRYLLIFYKNINKYYHQRPINMNLISPNWNYNANLYSEVWHSLTSTILN